MRWWKNIYWAIMHSMYNQACILLDDPYKEMKLAVRWGFTKWDSYPVRCHHCGSDKFDHTNRICDEGRMLEYDVTCECCHNIVGHWAYGNWQL